MPRTPRLINPNLVSVISYLDHREMYGKELNNIVNFVPLSRSSFVKKTKALSAP